MRIGRISSDGRLTVPADIRRRWQATRVTLDDRGDRLVIRPLPDDVVSAVRGSLKGKLRVPTEELRRRARADEEAAERRKWHR